MTMTATPLDDPGSAAAARTPKPWSPSAVRAARACHLRLHLMRTGVAQNEPSLPARRGMVLHAALAAAYREAALPGFHPRIGATMMEHWGTARTALNDAFVEHDIPHQASEAHALIEALRSTLQWYPRPRRGQVEAVEHEFLGVTSSGIPVRIKPDLVLRAGDVLTVIDWKSGHVDGQDPCDNDQMLIYAVILASLARNVSRIVVELRSIFYREVVTGVVDADRAARSMLAFERSVARYENDTAHTPTIGEHCLDCRVRRSCPALPGASVTTGSVARWSGDGR
jgi:hypothetical protein